MHATQAGDVRNENIADATIPPARRGQKRPRTAVVSVTNDGEPARPPPPDAGRSLADSHPGISRAMTLLLAVAGGAAVGNLYWAQPLLHYIAGALHITQAAAGLLITVTQIGYAVGVFLVVPLGDTANRRRLTPAIMGCSALALIGCALAPTYTVLLLALSTVGVTTVTGQLLTPLAGDLARDDQRGRVVGTVVSGILTGILLSRTISGILADAFGWRAIFAFAAAVTGLFAIVLARALPVTPRRPHLPYGTLLRSVFSVVREHRAAQVTLVMGACAFGVFTLFWTALTFLLSEPPFSYAATRIGMVGLVGLAGALAAQQARRLHDRGWSTPATGAGLLLALGSLAVAWAGSRSIVLILIAVLLIDIAIQGVNILNQVRLFSIAPKARSRLNTAFVTCNFLGGALGSALAGVLWQYNGWQGVTAGGAALITLALLVWATQRGKHGI